MRMLLGRRIAAYALDSLLLFIVLAPVGFLALRAVGHVPQTPQAIWYTLLATFSLPTWGYFIGSDQSARGATPGKRLLGIRVRTSSGDRVSPLRATGRTAVKLLPWELTHAAAFAFSTDLADFSTAQVVGLVAANVLVLVYLGIVLATRGRVSVHDLVCSTQVQLEAQPRPLEDAPTEPALTHSPLQPS